MSTVRIPLNLLNEPFRRDRPILVASAATAVLLAGVLVMLISIVMQQRNAARDARATIERYEGQLRALNAEYSKAESFLRQPENEIVLERSVFLNILLQRKGISWTRMFGDLEGIFPPSVRLVSVRPFVTPDNKVQLDMIVGAQAPDPVFDLLKRFESSAVFGAVTVQGSMPPSQNEPLHRYRLSVNYAQKL